MPSSDIRANLGRNKRCSSGRVVSRRIVVERRRQHGRLAEDAASWRSGNLILRYCYPCTTRYKARPGTMEDSTSPSEVRWSHRVIAHVVMRGPGRDEV